MTDSSPAAPVPVVGIGASAGGLEALEALFAAMPPDTPLAFTVIQHLSPDFESRMDDLLARHTRIPIEHVRDGQVVRPNTIYLAPPRKEMILSGGRLLLTDTDPSVAFALPIDYHFRSLAQELGSLAIGVVLSGTGSDGSRGVRDIHEAGGLVICQDPDTARFDGMPRSALETGVVDVTVEPGAIAAELELHALRAGKRPARPEVTPTTGLDEIFRLLRAEYGIDFAHYKPTTVRRRVERRLVMTSEASVDEYAVRLRGDVGELEALYRDLLIGVTRFFRDRAAFDVLERSVIPQLIAGRSGDDELRVWVPGCATGEEAYSIAILFREQLERAANPPQLRLFATDVHVASLEAAADGVFHADALEDLSAHQRRRFFQPVGPGRYRVTTELRESIVFARQNVIVDAPFTRLDLISCRNLLIYLQPAAQKKVFSLFHFGLRTGGVLFLGPSETTGALHDEFEPIDHHWKVFRKRRDVRLPIETRLAGSSRALAATAAPGIIAPAPRFPDGKLLRLYERLLGNRMPPGLLVDGRLQLLHSFNGAERITRLPSGKLSTHVLDLVPTELKGPLSGALRRARRDRTAIRCGPISVDDEQLAVTVEPLFDPRNDDCDFVVGFEHLREAAPDQPATVDVDSAQGTREYVDSLETELRFTQENLQATVEELETSNEELQATNEELVASNEELQSTNEELHSVNEELYSVNAEHQKQIADLRELTADLDNLLHSLDVGVVFLDRDLRIRKFTSKVMETFQLLPQDVGRRFDTFHHTIDDVDLQADVARVLRTARPVEREVRSKAGAELFLRVLPYRAHGELTGVVVTFVDIGSLKAAQASVRRLSAIVESSSDAILGKDLDGIITDWNRGAETLYGYTADEVRGRHLTLIVPDDRRDELDDIMRRVAAGEALEPFETRRLRKDGHPLDVSVTVSPIRDAAGQVTGASAIARDITARKRAEREVQRSVQQRDQFLAMLSHELRNPLMGMLTAAELLECDDLDDSRRRHASNVIQRQARQMARLLDDLLDVSRMRRDRIEMRVRRFDLREIVEPAMDAVRAGAREAGVELELAIDGEPVWVDGDRARLQQLLVNLAANAMKYTPAGAAIRVRVAGERDAAIEVADEGIGIPPELQDAIFEPFQQGEDPLRGSSGMGLGLALVRSIARAHGGEVTVTSPGRNLGSTFTVRLPIADRPVQREPATVPRSFDRSGARPTILLVEDQADNLELLHAALVHNGYEVVTAATGAEAIALLGRGRPDVAIVDLGLPDMSGLQVARAAREMYPANGLRLIALTGHGRQKDRDDVLAAGFDEHLVKPVRLALLHSVINRTTPAEA